MESKHVNGQLGTTMNDEKVSITFLLIPVSWDPLSELSDRGAKRLSENTPKCICPNCTLAWRSSLGPAGFGLKIHAGKYIFLKATPWGDSGIIFIWRNHLITIKYQFEATKATIGWSGLTKLFKSSWPSTTRATWIYAIEYCSRKYYQYWNCNDKNIFDNVEN